MNKYKIGYTQGVYDMFHIGHLNIIKNAKMQCDHLIVGVNSDRLVQEYKNKTPIICESERVEILKNIKGVDEVVLVDTLDKVKIYNEIRFNAIFIGSDHKGSTRWMQTEEDLKQYGVDVIYLPHTDGISSTDLRIIREGKVEE